MSETIQLSAILIFAVLVEMLVEYFVKPLIPTPCPESAEGPAERQPEQWWHNIPYARYAAALFAIALSYAYTLDALALMIPGIQPTLIGIVLTGLLISRGSNYVHDWIADPLVLKLKPGEPKPSEPPF